MKAASTDSRAIRAGSAGLTRATVYVTKAVASSTSCKNAAPANPIATCATALTASAHSGQRRRAATASAAAHTSATPAGTFVVTPGATAGGRVATAAIIAAAARISIATQCRNCKRLVRSTVRQYPLQPQVRVRP